MSDSRPHFVHPLPTHAPPRTHRLQLCSPFVPYVLTVCAGCVLVASFSAKVSARGGPGATSGWLEHPFLPQVYVPAPKQSLQAQALAAARKARKDEKERAAALTAAPL